MANTTKEEIGLGPVGADLLLGLHLAPSRPRSNARGLSCISRLPSSRRDANTTRQAKDDYRHLPIVYILARIMPQIMTSWNPTTSSPSAAGSGSSARGAGSRR